MRSLVVAVCATSLVACSKFIAEPIPHDLVISGGAIIDPTSATVSAPSDVFVSDGEIRAIVPAGTRPIADNVTVIDAVDQFLLPGLIDVHAHLGDGGLVENTEADRRQALAQFVRYGVTSIFVPGGGGGNDEQLAAWKTYCAAAENLCPRLFGSGSIITAYGSHPITTIWGFPADADPAIVLARGAIGIKEDHPVDELVQTKLAAKVDALKIVVEDGPGGFAPKPRLSREKVAEICTKAQLKGLRVFAHVSLAKHVEDVVDGGCNAIMHAPDDLIAEETLQKMAARKIFYVATLSLFDALMDQAANRREQEGYAIAGVSPQALRSLGKDSQYWEVGAESPEIIAAWQSALASNLTRASDFGVPIALGTDTNNPQIFPGYAVHEELVLMVAAGLSNSAALESATSAAAAFLQRGDELGRIATGYRADILILRRNPLDDIINTRSIEHVVMGGSGVGDIVSEP